MRKTGRSLCVLAVLALSLQHADAAELVTGAILGTVSTTARAPIAGARIVATAPSGRYAGTTDASGRFTILGVAPDTYAVSVEANGFEPANATVVVLPGAHERLAVVLLAKLKEIARVEASTHAFAVGSTSDVFTVQGEQARAGTPQASSSGLGDYSRDSIQGAISSVPGVQQDSFANVIVRGGKVQDTVYDYDSVPVPQGLIAEPGGNIVGAQLGTAGVGSETVTLGGYNDVSQNALGGVVNEVPLTGTYPGAETFEFADGIGTQLGEMKFTAQEATPDLRWRYALSTTTGSEYFAYGDGRTFYPAESGTYGLGFQTRAQYAIAGNVHLPRPRKTISRPSFSPAQRLTSNTIRPIRGCSGPRSTAPPRRSPANQQTRTSK